jgi:nucleotide-binding universal stress UspA family protein
MRGDAMTPFRTLVLAADFSENSKEVFRAAVSLADEEMSRLIVIHVVEPSRAPDRATDLGQRSAPLDERVDTGDHESLRQKLSEVYAPRRPIDVACHVREGEISEEILRMAGEAGADLIVVGTHGRTGLRRMLMGSIATAVLRGAHCPVLALRSGAQTHPGQQFQVILHPTDFSVSSEAALRAARTLARNLGARLVVVHVAPVAVVMGGTMAAEIDPQYDLDLLEAIRHRLDGPDLEYPMETRLVQGLEPEEILRVAREVSSDLIVMGTHGRTGMGRLLMGSVAESVLARADCPVMVVKSFQRAADAPSGQPHEQKAVSIR